MHRVAWIIWSHISHVAAEQTLILAAVIWRQLRMTRQVHHGWALALHLATAHVLAEHRHLTLNHFIGIDELHFRWIPCIRCFLVHDWGAHLFWVLARQPSMWAWSYLSLRHPVPTIECVCRPSRRVNCLFEQILCLHLKLWKYVLLMQLLLEGGGEIWRNWVHIWSWHLKCVLSVRASHILMLSECHIWITKVDPKARLVVNKELVMLMLLAWNPLLVVLNHMLLLLGGQIFVLLMRTHQRLYLLKLLVGQVKVLLHAQDWALRHSSSLLLERSFDLGNW